MKNSAEEIRALKAIVEMAEAAKRQADALEKIEDHMTGVINLLDDIDTRLSHIAVSTENLAEA